MNKSGKGVLWFLGGCMAFTEAALGTIVKLSTSVKVEYVVVLCIVSLFLVLTALVLMFFKNPQLLIAQSSDLIPLALLERIQGWEDPRLVQMVLNRLINRDSVMKEEDEMEEISADIERNEYLDAMKALES